MATITTFYPCPETPDSLCTLCNTTQSSASSCTSSDSSNSSNNTMDCSSYCNVGCNSKCNEAQTLCNTGHQLIQNHSDVGGYPGEEIQPNDIIKDKWTPTFWNSLINKVNTAEQVGKISIQGSNLSMTEVAAPQPITAKLYNDLNTKLCNFNVTYNQVAQNDLITAAVANAIKNAYEQAKFNVNVCDVCNVSERISLSCQCNCNCACSCDCHCGCSCNCGCNCSCNCSCNCTCSCSKPGSS